MITYGRTRQLILHLIINNCALKKREQYSPGIGEIEIQLQRKKMLFETNELFPYILKLLRQLTVSL